MKILVISDIHQKHARAQKIIDSVEHDRCVLLGDYFDDYGDLTHETRNTATWLRDSVLTNPKIVPIFGNHDCSYFWPANPHPRCSGYSGIKSMVINSVLTAEHKTKFKVYHIEQNFLFSHAGFSNSLWKQCSLRFERTENESKINFVDRILAVCVEEAIIELNAGRNHWLFAAGWDRGGFQRYGGITWGDWTNFAPVNGINQIFGHTPHKIPEVLIQKAGGGYTKRDVIKQSKYPIISKENILSVNYDLDTALGHYAVIEDGKIDIFDFFNEINVEDVKKYYIPDNRMSTLS